MVQGHQDPVVGRIMAQVSLFLRALYGNIPHSAKKSSLFTLWGTVLFTHWIIDGSVAKVNTHLGRYPKESCDEIITLQYTLLLELQGEGGGGRGREGRRGVCVCVYVSIHLSLKRTHIFVRTLYMCIVHLHGEQYQKESLP